MVVMMKNAMWFGLALTLVGLVTAPAVRADEWNKKTILTFSKPVEIPGQVLAAGTYTFKLLDSMSDRHIVQVFNADGSKILATLITIPDYRLTSTDKTVINFGEVPAGSPEAIRAWFYPGNTIGNEFVYPKSRATVLAKAAKTAVPAILIDTADIDALKAAPIVAVTPDETEVPVAAAIQTTPPAATATSDAAPTTGTLVATAVATSGTMNSAARERRNLPTTAGNLPLLLLLGFASIGVAAGLTMWTRRAVIREV
jgi:hypothetical protein